MRVEHVALWTGDLDRSAKFYETYFGAEVGELYRNDAKGFASRFLVFPHGGARLEIMTTTTLELVVAPAGAHRLGIAHFAVSVGSDAAVDALTARMRDDGVPVVDGPRRTGDGYYESVVLDPDGNRVEVTA